MLIAILSIITLNCLKCQAQLFGNQKGHTKIDSLRGFEGKNRTTFDVIYYDIDIEVMPEKKSLKGQVKALFKWKGLSDSLQFDLYPNMILDKVSFKEQSLSFNRIDRAILIKAPENLVQDSLYFLTFQYHGKPQIAVKPPWDGGFVFTKDEVGNPWIAVACQGAGASLWWPNKDHPNDEADSVQIAVTLPSNLQNISNGQFRGTKKLQNERHKITYFVSYPINNYNITLNIGNFSHFEEKYHASDNSIYKLQYYVKPYNLEKAKKHFKQVKPMLSCFENLFGAYPFSRDGFKLIETPYLGMEHQSAVAYGNQYRNGYLGGAHSKWGMKFDFIIIHESGHEWWGNKVSASDLADLWIHESFTTYSEVLYVACQFGDDAADQYAHTQKNGILNDSPIQGIYNINNEGSGDMYLKGSVVLHSLSKIFGKEKWLTALKQIQDTFAYKTVDYMGIVNSLNKSLGADLSPYFHQYFQTVDIPILNYRIVKGTDTKYAVEYYWTNVVKGFKMPVTIIVNGVKKGQLIPTTASQLYSLKKGEKSDIHFDNYNFLYEMNFIK